MSTILQRYIGEAQAFAEVIADLSLTIKDKSDLYTVAVNLKCAAEAIIRELDNEQSS